MIIQMDTDRKTVTELPHEEENTVELQTVIANLIATALVGQAVKNYNHDEIRLIYIDNICNAAKGMLKGVQVHDRTSEFEENN